MQSIPPTDTLTGTIKLPADKSISHRAALFASLHDGTSIIEGYSNAADPQSTLACLEKLDVEIKKEDDVVSINGLGRDGWLSEKSVKELDCGNSGTTMRLLAGLLGGAGVRGCLKGDDSLSARPMKRILDPLQQMGIDIKGNAESKAPLCIDPGYEVKGMTYELPIPSAQLKSCVLLAGLFGDQETTVIESIPSRDHTERMLELPIEQGDTQRKITSHSRISIPNQSGMIPGDFSAAAFWMVGGSISKQADITLDSVGLNPTRIGALQILQEMGANITISPSSEGFREPVGNIQIQASELKAISINEQLIPNCIDELPILAVAMAFADGVSRVDGAGELRVKETDRLAAIADMLSAANVRFEMWEDGFKIWGNPHHTFDPTVFKSYGDHRIAMSAAILSLKSVGPCSIHDPKCIDISYPSFFDHLDLLTG